MQAFALPVKHECAESVRPTPGEKVAIKQREVFVKERLIELFGAETVDALGIDWEALSNETIPFEHSQKRHGIHRIKQFMKLQTRTHSGNEAFESLNYGLSIV